MGAESGGLSVSTAAQEAVNALRTAAATLIGEVAAERDRRVAAEREAEMLGGKLAEAHELIRRLQSVAPAFTESERESLELSQGPAERTEAVAEFGGGAKGTMEDPFPWSRVKLGLCPRCNMIVYSGEKFAVHQVSWGADFAGDVPGLRRVFTHRACGGGDHSKDGV